MNAEDAAKIADMYAEENFRLAQDTILTDPILRGRANGAADIKTSENLQVWGCIYSARAHAAQDIAAAIRKAAESD